MKFEIPYYIQDLPIVALYTFIVYVLLIVGFRFIGRRQLGQLNVVDLVIILIMGSAVETAMVHGNVSLPAGIVSAGTLLLTNRLITKLASKWSVFRRFVSPGPVLIVSRGKMIEEHIKRYGLTEEDVLQAIRQRGYDDLSKIKFAVMEEDGEINVVCNDTTIGEVQNITTLAPLSSF